MKIYRTITLSKLILVFIILPAFFVAVNLFRNPATEFAFSIELVFTILSVMGFAAMAVLGPMHYKYLSPLTAGYKYFRSLPDAYNSFKRNCIKVSGGFAAVGAAILVMLAFTGFTNITLSCILTMYAFIYAMQHIIAQSESANTANIHIITAGGSMGVITGALDDVTAAAPPAFVIIFPAVMILVAAGCTAYFYSRFDTLWYRE